MILSLILSFAEPPTVTTYVGFGYELRMELALQEWFDEHKHQKLSDVEAD